MLMEVSQNLCLYLKRSFPLYSLLHLIKNLILRRMDNHKKINSTFEHADPARLAYAGPTMIDANGRRWHQYLQHDDRKGARLSHMSERHKEHMERKKKFCSKKKNDAQQGQPPQGKSSLKNNIKLAIDIRDLSALVAMIQKLNSKQQDLKFKDLKLQYLPGTSFSCSSLFHFSQD